MVAYWLLFMTPLLAVLNGRGLQPRQNPAPWFLVLSFIALLIGWRHRVGGDWGAYVRHFESYSFLQLQDVFSRGDPGYTFINWLVAQAGGSIYSVNLICAAIFTYGLGVFCARQPQPWLALLVAIPYLVIVVAMGYTRQSVAIGLIMIALTRIEDRRFVGFLAYAVLAALFHKSALVMIPLAALAMSRGRVMTLGMAAVVVVAGYQFLVADDADKLMRVYIVEEYKAADGGPVRVMMNALPAALFLLFRNRFGLVEESKRLWTVVSIVALVAIPAVFVVSTATDRLSLYLIPLQIMVLSRLQFPLGRANASGAFAAIILYCALVQLVWLLYASNASHWIPYGFYLFS
jgi:hypothetical protein